MYKNILRNARYEQPDKPDIILLTESLKILENENESQENHGNKHRPKRWGLLIMVLLRIPKKQKKYNDS